MNVPHHLQHPAPAPKEPCAHERLIVYVGRCGIVGLGPVSVDARCPSCGAAWDGGDLVDDGTVPGAELTRRTA